MQYRFFFFTAVIALILIINSVCLIYESVLFTKITCTCTAFCFHVNECYEFNVCTFDFHFDGASTATFGTLSFYFKCLSLDSHSTCKGFSHMEALFYASCYKTLLHRFQTVNFQIHVP